MQGRVDEFMTHQRAHVIIIVRKHCTVSAWEMADVSNSLTLILTCLRTHEHVGQTEHVYMSGHALRHADTT